MKNLNQSFEKTAKKWLYGERERLLEWPAMASSRRARARTAISKLNTAERNLPASKMERKESSDVEG